MDKNTIQWLSLISGSPSFVIRMGPNSATPTIIQVDKVPSSDGTYWVAGRTTINRGDRLDSVFDVDTDSRGELSAVYWKISGKWYSHTDTTAVCKALGVEKKDIFPFDWSHHVKLERDIFHD